MLNDGNNEGRTTDDEFEPPGASRHPASTTSRTVRCSRLYDAKRWMCVSKNVDWLARRIFPLTFVVFNLVYWSVYLSPPHFHCDLTKYGIIDQPCFNTHDPVFSFQ